MSLIIISIFLIGYLFITFEHFTKIDKLIPALLMMTLSWAVISMNIDQIQSWYDVFKNGFSDISYTINENYSMIHYYIILEKRQKF
jgi:hypothetical protein